jgi:hypothetical protein
LESVVFNFLRRLVITIGGKITFPPIADESTFSQCAGERTMW